MEQAIEYYARVLALEPNNTGALNNIGSCYIHLHRPDEGVPYLERAIDLNPNTLEPHLNLAEHYMEEGQLDNASHHLTRAYALSKNDGFRMRRILLLPPVVDSEAHIDALRTRLHHDGLGGWHQAYRCGSAQRSRP